jgi:hypothetical protein
MFAVLKKCRQLNLSIDCQLDMFDKIIKPILLYGCEIWGFSNLDIIERLHLKFCKYVLSVNKSTPSFMIYGELGRYPVSINVKVRMVTFWASLVNSHDFKLSSILLRLAAYNSSSNDIKISWLTFIKNILNECGLCNIYECAPVNVLWLKNTVKQILCDQFLQKWNRDKEDSPKGYNYNMFKQELRLENYLLKLPSTLAKVMCKFRTGNAKLPIETGRWYNIERHNRICNLCNTDVGDEFHYIFNCPSLSVERKLYIPNCYTKRPNANAFYYLFSTRKRSVLVNLYKYIKHVMERVNPPG